jgi:anthraniloyl-CoA monooxygenase
MRVAVVGGGPGGLSFAAFLKARRPAWQVTVWEREWPPPSGFGLVLPGRTLARIGAADPDLAAALRPLCVRWSRIDVHYRGRVVCCDGHDYWAVGRLALLTALRARCRALGVDLRCGRVDAVPRRDRDLLVGADGARSTVRGDRFGTRLRRGRCVYAWLAVDRRFDAFAFHVTECDRGVVQLHAYPYGDGVSTVIVEMADEVWRRFHPGLAEPGPGPVPLPSPLRRLLAAELGPVALGDTARWQRFCSVEVDAWSAGDTVLLGDAAHACHFSVGSGTKLAMEDALALAECLAAGGDRAAALARYEQLRRPAVEATRTAAEASRAWFEDIARHLCPDQLRFAERLLTRSGRPPAGPLRLRLRPAPDRPPGPAAPPPSGAGVGQVAEAVGEPPHLP